MRRACRSLIAAESRVPASAMQLIVTGARPPSRANTPDASLALSDPMAPAAAPLLPRWGSAHTKALPLPICSRARRTDTHALVAFAR